LHLHFCLLLYRVIVLYNDTVLRFGLGDRVMVRVRVRVWVRVRDRVRVRVRVTIE
jgi:hypothetical protein